MKKDHVTRALALGYIFLGLYYWQGHTSLNKQTIASFSITALLFVLSDAFKAYSEKYSREHIIFRSLQGIASLLFVAAFVVAVIGPNLDFSKLDFANDYYDILSTTASLIGLGFSLYIIAKRNEKQEE